MHRQLNLNYQYNLVDDAMIAAFQADAIVCAACGGISPVYPAERSRADALESMVGASLIQSAAGPKWKERLSFCGVKCEKAMFCAISEIKARGKEEESESDINEALADLLYNMPPKCKVPIFILIYSYFFLFVFYIYFYLSLFTYIPKGNIRGIVSLQLEGTDLSDEFFQHLTILTNLTDLNVSSTNISISSLEGIPTPSHMKISFISMMTTTELSTLRTLRLAHWPPEFRDVDQLSQCLPQLTELDLSNIRPMSSSVILSFALFSQLEKLALRKCGLNPKKLEALSGIQHKTQHTQLNTHLLTTRSELVLLTELDLSKNKDLGEEDAALLFQGTFNLFTFSTFVMGTQSFQSSSALPDLNRLFWGQSFLMDQRV